MNSELPVNSRIHVVEEFNKNVYEIIIASDEHEVLGEKDRDGSANNKSDESRPVIPDDAAGTSSDVDQLHQTLAPKQAPAVEEQTLDSEKITKPPKKKRNIPKKDKEYGISRGIDFRNVACVLNFDLPLSSRSYTHRIGRTARAGNTGMALSFVVPTELYGKHKATTFPTAENDEVVLDQITRYQSKKGKEVKPYHFEMKQVEAFRYRMVDALRAVTRLAIREARTKELRQELIKSEKLKRHFEENPEDLHHLRHDGELRAVRVQPHLKHVPDYLMPSNGAKTIAGEIGFVPMRKATDNRIRKARMQKRIKGKGRKNTGRRADPLKTFSVRGRQK